MQVLSVDIYIYIYIYIYTIARTFKEFKDSQLRPSKVYNVIYYFGLTHSMNLKGMLEIMGFKNRAETEKIKYTEKIKDSIRCLRMKDFPQPLFKHKK